MEKELLEALKKATGLLSMHDWYNAETRQFKALIKKAEDKINSKNLDEGICSERPKE